MIQQFEKVRVLRDVPERGVGAGTVGIVLDIFGDEPRDLAIEVPGNGPEVAWYDSLLESDVEWVPEETPYLYVAPVPQAGST